MLRVGAPGLVIARQSFTGPRHASLTERAVAFFVPLGVLKTLKLARERHGVGRAVVGVHRQVTQADGVELRRDVLARCSLARRLRVAAPHLGEHLVDLLACKRRAPREDVVEHRAEAVDVALWPHQVLQAHRLLGAHVVGRPDDRAHARHAAIDLRELRRLGHIAPVRRVGVNQASEAEIDERDLAVIADQHVRRL